MKKYDVVIGSGCGMNIVNEALAHGLNVALVDKGPLGGTCPNLGCIPSKMLIFAADRIAEIQEARKLGIEAEIRKIDFNFIMERMRKSVSENQEHMRHGSPTQKSWTSMRARGTSLASTRWRLTANKSRVIRFS
jgi:mycothione reductase